MEPTQPHSCVPLGTHGLLFTTLVVYRTEGEGITAGKLYGVTAFKVGPTILHFNFVIMYTSALSLIGEPYRC